MQGLTTTIPLTSEAACSTCHGSGARPGTTPHTCPQCDGRGVLDDNQGFFSFSAPCQVCRGQGYRVDDPCPTCGGAGVEHKARKVKVRIPAGVRDAQRIRLAGKGNAGTHGGQPGALYLVIKTAFHPVFTRQVDDIHITVPITSSEAALGAKIEVPTIDGRAQLKIPPGTQSGQKLRMRERGVPSSAREGLRGDQIVQVEIVVPHLRDERSKEILREFSKLNPEDPRSGIWAKV